MTGARVTAIYLRPEKGGPVERVEVARAGAGQGLEGDHHWSAAGSVEREGKDITFIAAEELERLTAEDGIELQDWEPRRNVVTHGIDLNGLVGKRFTVGEVECVGRLLCEPCTTFARRTHPGVLKALVHRAGLRADIVAGGSLNVGDPIRLTA